MKQFYLIIFVFLTILCGCSKKCMITSEPFGTLSTGEDVTIWHMENRNGASMDVTDYGCRIVSIHMPDRNGKMGDVVVGYGDLDSFEKKDRFLGPVIGRFGNRIDNASFVLDGVRYDVDANEKYDGEQGFPGNMNAYVTYWLTDDNTVILEYEADTDKPTVVNLSNHTYFNLRGNEGCYVMEHLLQVEADTCVQNNSHLCPDKLLHVQGTPFDFRQPQRVDYRIDMPNEHLRIMKGMSACWVIRDWDGTLRRAADLYDAKSGRGVETWTTEPALLTFTGRTFSAKGYPDGKYGPIEKFGGMLLETIHFPDSPNQDRFPSTVLRPGEKYHTMTEYRFYTR